MKTSIKIPAALRRQIIEDLKRPHEFAYERVGFIYAEVKKFENEDLVILCNEYSAVKDNNYIRASEVGAKINAEAIRSAMQNVLDKQKCCLHVHLHSHKGSPYPSVTDSESLPQLAKSFVNVSRGNPHGYLILSEDSEFAELCWHGEDRRVDKISIIGYPMNFSFDTSQDSRINSDLFKRQAFLGDSAQFLFQNIKIGIVGYGGGGSHIGQQLAHIGFKNVVVFDHDQLEGSNMNRLVGGHYVDIKNQTNKTEIAKRVFNNIQPNNNLHCVNAWWQDSAELIQSCDIVIGCLDTYYAREQLEAECRRYLIPLIDIGMDIQNPETTPYMSGQVILSMPGKFCFKCCGFITDDKLSIEAQKYGSVEGAPQVIWPNGILASSAVGVLVDLITGWTLVKDRDVYMAYDGNYGFLIEHDRLKYTAKQCTHYQLESIGAVKFTSL